MIGRPGEMRPHSHQELVLRDAGQTRVRPAYLAMSGPASRHARANGGRNRR